MQYYDIVLHCFVLITVKHCKRSNVKFWRVFILRFRLKINIQTRLSWWSLYGLIHYEKPSVYLHTFLMSGPFLLLRIPVSVGDNKSRVLYLRSLICRMGGRRSKQRKPIHKTDRTSKLNTERHPTHGFKTLYSTVCSKIKLIPNHLNPTTLLSNINSNQWLMLKSWCASSFWWKTVPW